MSLFFCLAASAATRYVVPSGTAGNVPASPYESWASAANDLASVLAVCADGDEILVKGGTYAPTAAVTVPKRVVLRGVKDGGTVPTFSGASFTGTDQFLLFSGLSGSADCAIDGLAFDGFGATAVKVSETANVTVKNSSFANGTVAHSGGGVWIDGAGSAGCVVSNCTFASLSATATEGTISGGAVYATAQALISDCTFRNCSSKSFGGSVSTEGASSVIARCTFTGTQNSAYGATVSLGGANSVIRQCTFAGITSTSALSTYGVLLLRGASAMADGCAFYDNTFTDLTCIIMFYSSSQKLRNCLVAPDNSGMANVFHWYAVGGTMQIDNCTFLCRGDHLFIDSKSWAFSFSFRNCIVVGDTADRTGGKVSYSYSNCLTSNDGGYVYAANGNYRLRPTAPFIDKGATLDWHATGTDLYGRARVAGDRVDIGCSEYYATDEQYSETLRVVATAAEKTGAWADAYVGGAGLASASEAAGGNALVLVKGGTYSFSSPITLTDRDITYRSASATDETKIDCDGTVLDGGSASRLFTLAMTDQHPHVVGFEGLSFRNGKQTGSDTAGQGGAIRMSVANTKVDTPACQIRNCAFSGCEAVYGGALYLQGGMVLNSTFRNCLGGASGMGGFIYTTGYPVVDGCLFTGTCGAQYGSILSLWDGNTDATVRNCTFAGLTCTRSTYGWMTFTSGGVFENCIITNNANSSKCSSAFFAHGNSRRMALRNCLVAGNGNVSTIFSAYAGGRYDLENATVSMTDSAALNSTVYTDISICNSIVEASSWNAESTSKITVDHSVTNDVCAAGFLSLKRLDYHLKSSSPYVDAGVARDWHTDATDLDGRPRTAGGAVDIGCYERQEGDSDYTETLRVVATEAEKTGVWADAKVGLAAAVSAAADNALVLVKAGTHAMAATADAGDRSITLRSQTADGSGTADPKDAVLDGQGARRIFRAKIPVSDDTGVPSDYRRIVIEGFTFRNGRAVIGDGQADEGLGGGLCLVGAAPRAGLPPSEIANCRFENCEAQYGGGAAVWGGVFRNCVFDGNVATNEISSVSAGKTVYTHNGAGGAICTMQRGVPVSVRDCTPGCLWYELGLVGCTFTNNIAWNIGGAVAATPSDATYANRPTPAYVRNCDFTDNRLLCLRADQRHASALGPLSYSFVSNCTFRANVGEYGALRFGPGSFLADATFDGNSGNYGEFACASANCEIERCRFLNPKGYATFGYYTARNCLFVSKENYHAIELYTYGGIVTSVYENCTFVKLGANVTTSVFYHMITSTEKLRTNLRLDNCVIDQPSGDAFTSFDKLATVTVNNCRFLKDWDGLKAADLVATDLTYGRTGVNLKSGDYELRNSSPCRDAGKVLDWMGADAIDLAGKPRVFGPKPDLGCYELQEARKGVILFFR